MTALEVKQKPDGRFSALRKPYELVRLTVAHSQTFSVVAST